MHGIVSEAVNYIDLDLLKIIYLFLVGFIGGLVSGFIGSGVAFVLTPAMMSLGVPGLVAVASNMCHKFPKALIGAIKRAKYGQVDIKLGIILGISAEAGILYGANINENIKKNFGDVGSNLYVSVIFVIILAIVSCYILKDAWKIYKSKNVHEDEKVTKLSRWVQSINIPWTMVYFKSLNSWVSVLFTIPLGFATGMLAATIAVGGFIGVPSMIYVLGAPSLMASATELVIAFVMGLGGSLKYAMHGFVDIRLSMIILAGSLFGIHLGAIGTTYVKPFMIKVVMAVIMIIVLFSVSLMIPVYLSQLGLIWTLNEYLIKILQNTSFIVMVIALFVGAFIVLRAIWMGQKMQGQKMQDKQIHRVQVDKKILVAFDGSSSSKNALRQAIKLAQIQRDLIKVVVVTPSYDGELELTAIKNMDNIMKYPAQMHIKEAENIAKSEGIQITINLEQGEPYERITAVADDENCNIIVMGRRGLRGLERAFMGSVTARVISYSKKDVLVIPMDTTIGWKRILLATDGSKYSQDAVDRAIDLAKSYKADLLVLSVVNVPSELFAKTQSILEGLSIKAKGFVENVMKNAESMGIKTSIFVIEGDAYQVITDLARKEKAEMIIMGSHGRTGFKKLIMGSVTEEVISHTSCPVLIVYPQNIRDN